MKILKIIIFSLILFSLSCNREIVLRRESIENPPFRNIDEGFHKLSLYRVEYPKTLAKKQEFYQKFTDLLRRYYLEGRQISMLIREDYYTDNIFLREYQLLKEEMLLSKVASTLDEYEKEELRNLVPININKFKNTTQEYLNLQIAYLMKFFQEFENFDPEKAYTEREKNNLITKLRDLRKENLKLIERTSLDIILEIESPYLSEENFGNTYWNEKNINLRGMSPFRPNINTYSYPLYIKSIEKEEVEKILKREVIIDNKLLILENEKHTGYLHNNGEFIFLIGGSNKLNQYKNYFIELEIIDASLEDLVNINEDLTLKDFIGGGK